MDGEKVRAAPKWAKAPKFGKAVKFGNGVWYCTYWYIYLEVYEETLPTSAGPLLRRFRAANTDEVWVRIPAGRSCDV